jgi:hypothetical protein
MLICDNVGVIKKCLKAIKWFLNCLISLSNEIPSEAKSTKYSVRRWVKKCKFFAA